MNGIEIYSLKNEKMQKDERELFYLIHKLVLKARVVCREEALKVFLDSDTRGVNKRAERQENIMKVLEEVDAVLVRGRNRP